MCCIFTCCGWLIDLFQRAWVFAMSFCMSGAVCCVLTLGSMAGVALGYNYSLAEYMDLKETNVSVYLKRGVFDDEGMSDDMNFRRSGEEEEGPEQMPNQMRRSGGGNQADDSSVLRGSGRRLDDSLLQSNQNHGFEGGLVKLTMAPPFAITTTTPLPRRDPKVEDIFMKHAPGSLDQLKDVQSLINYRKTLAAREPGKPGDHLLLDGYPPGLNNEQNYLPPHILNAQSFPGRRFWQAPSTPEQYTWQNYLPGKMHPAMMAVPPPHLHEQQYWEAFKKSSPGFLDEYIPSATSPQAIRLNTLGEDMFPTEAIKQLVFTEENVLPSPRPSPSEFMNIGLDSGGQGEQKLILDKYVPYLSSTKPYARERGKEDAPKSDNEYYDDDIKGLPVRRKRNIRGIKRKAKRQNAPRPEQENSFNNFIAYTDPSVLILKLVSKYKVNTDASDLKSKLENTPLYDQLISNKVYETDSSILMRESLGKTRRGLNKISHELNDAKSEKPNFINQRRFVFSFSTVFVK